jgi:glycosyltransferase involved in cell wall biosynthesis
LRPLYINGKFLTQRMTGVQRFAENLVLALDRVAPAEWLARCVLLVPAGARVPALRRLRVRRAGPAALRGHAWEQLCLPWAARDGRLLSLAGSAPWLGRRAVATVHDAAVFDHPEAYTPLFVAWYRQLFHRLARSAAGLLTVSRFSQSRLAARLGTAADRWRIVPNGADHLRTVPAAPRALERLGLRPGAYLLAVGSRNPTKNLRALEQAFRGLGPAGVDLVLVGGGDARVFAGGSAPMASLVETGTAARVLHTGVVDDGELRALYEGALALVFPSTYEGFGLPPLEAMACGCPVAVARAAALPEVCGEAALYFEPGSEGSLRAAIKRLLGDAALRERLREIGRTHAAQYSWDAAARCLLAALEGTP